MHGIDNKSSTDGSHSPPPGQVRLETPKVICAGRSVIEPDKEIENKPSLQVLSSLSLSMIFSHLKFRDVSSLTKVCTRFRDLINEDNALAKAWYRQFSSPHQYQLRKTINTKNGNQLRAWLQSFTNDEAVLTSFKDCKPESVYLPARLYFTKTRLMSECKTFKLVNKATIKEDRAIRTALLSVDGRHMVTVAEDPRERTPQIYVYKTDGSWENITTIPHEDWVNSVIFSLDGDRVLTACSDGTVKIYDKEADGSWKHKATLANNRHSLSFIADERHVLTTSRDGTTMIHGLKDDGSWELPTTLSHNARIESAALSADGCHLVTAGFDYTAKIHSQKTDGSWEVKGIIPHKSLVYTGNFSPDSHYIVTASRDFTAKIYGRQADGSWLPEITIEHDCAVKSANFSPDGHYVLTASNDCTVKIYYLNADEKWIKKATFNHDDGVNSASFSPDSRHLVTASWDGTAKIIGQNDDGSWSEKARIYHKDNVLYATFSADGSHVITAGRDCEVQITELRMNDSLAAVIV
ncbi:F-box/WD repeat-containing protein [Endozoicomonas sp. ALD040]|uniref:F-box/WD repeat-containing protein n=1 Tax=Endozoicomonas sp. ALD040 TaxID=3403079 RepID=UPI003BB16CB6